MTESTQKRLPNRRVIVTGAASGIGLATSRLFVEQGARVVMVDRDADRLQAAALEVGASAKAFAVDVSDEAGVARVVADAAEWLNGIDGIVNAAGLSRRVSFEQQTSAQWHEIISANLNGPFFVCKAALPFLRSANSAATIVNIASGVALRPIMECTAYAASKGGLIAFGKALAVDLAPFNIRVNTVCPGIVETPMIRRSIDRSPDPQAEINRLFERRLLKRFGRPEEIAHAILFLTAEECAYVSGSVFAIDGGGTLH